MDTPPTGQPSIYVSKPDVMVDQKVGITIDGLHSNQKISLLSTLKENEKIFVSCGHFVADERGQVDTSVHRSYGGSFTGLQPMGLFTSTKELFGSSRLLKRDVTTPYGITLTLHDGHLDFERLAQDFVESRISPLAVASLRRWYIAPGVRRIPIHEGRIYGALFLPPGDGPFPGILDVFGMAGGLIDFRAALLASYGFVTFSLAYIAYKDLTENPFELKSSYFLEAVDWLSRHPMVTRGGIGMVANCYGGNLSLATAALSSQVKVLVSTNANPVSIFPVTFETGDEKVQPLQYDPTKGTFTKEGVIWKTLFKDETLTNHFIPIWTGDVKALIIVGEADLCTNVEWQREYEAVIPSAKKDNFRFVYYPDAGHLIEPPYSPHCKASYSKLNKVIELWGGSTEAHLIAQEKAWSETIEFLTRHLARKSKL